MRLILTCLLLFVKGLTFSQLSEDFSDGDFSNNPAWQGMTQNFEIDLSNTLHLLAPSISDTSYLSTSSVLLNDVSWEFKVDLDFGTSSSNLARVYLVADQSNLKQTLNGYFIQIGGSDDEVSLFRQDGQVVQKIIDGSDGFVGSNPVSVKVNVTRTFGGDWEVLADNTGGTNYTSQGSINDNTYSTTNYFGVFCKYTATRSDKFYFDDFLIETIGGIDTIAPQITSIDVIDDHTLYLWFTEGLDTSSAEVESNYNADQGLGEPSNAELIAGSPNGIKLSYASNFQNQVDYQLSVQNIEDDSGNIMLPTTIHFIYNQPFIAAYRDIRISEIMADPTPIVNLPDGEYIELYNQTETIINLNGWSLSDESSTVTLPEVLIPPNTYFLLAQTGVGSQYGLFNVLEINLPQFNNGGDAAVIKDGTGELIDSIYYSSDWYKDPLKSDGGWSLELKNLNSDCNGISNWTASINTNGGTPGFENSVEDQNEDLIEPKVINTFLDSDSIVHVLFDEGISNGDIQVSPNVSFDYAITNENELVITFSGLSGGIFYDLEISGYEDCSGNVIEPFKFTFGMPEIPEQGDIIINELLFNPVSNGSDYVELVNVSNKILALSDFSLANIEDGVIDNIKPLSEKQVLFFPNQYLVFTKDSSDVITNFPQYKVGQFIQTDLPSYNNDSGTVILQGPDELILDQFSYIEDFHFKLIDDLNGKALERLSFTEPTNLVDNWHTASEQIGWGTPGYQNSQISQPFINGEIVLSQAIFSPNNDGYQDVLEINYTLEGPDNVMDIVIYNSNGIPIRELKDNFYPGINGIITWDGIDDQGTKANIGTYIIAITIFDLEGHIQEHKLVGVLAGQL